MKTNNGEVHTAPVIDRRLVSEGASGLQIGNVVGTARTAVAVRTAIDWDAVARNDLRDAAYHESGHAVVCWHFRIPWMLSRFEQTTATMEMRGADAQLSYIPGDWATPFRLASVGWAGVMAEFILNEEDEYICYETYTEFEEMSPSDQRLVEGTPFRWRALTAAARILKRQWADVETNATRFLERHRLGLLMD